MFKACYLPGSRSCEPYLGANGGFTTTTIGIASWFLTNLHPILGKPHGQFGLEKVDLGSDHVRSLDLCGSRRSHPPSRHVFGNTWNRRSYASRTHSHTFQRTSVERDTEIKTQCVCWYVVQCYLARCFDVSLAKWNDGLMWICPSQGRGRETTFKSSSSSNCKSCFASKFLLFFFKK